VATAIGASVEAIAMQVLPKRFVHWKPLRQRDYSLAGPSNLQSGGVRIVVDILRATPYCRLAGNQSELDLPLGPVAIACRARWPIASWAGQARRVEPPSDEGVLWCASKSSHRRPAAGVVLCPGLGSAGPGALLAPEAFGARWAVHDVDGAAVWHGPRRRQRAQRTALHIGPGRHYR
jgi:hypothetical protein